MDKKITLIVLFFLAAFATLVSTKYLDDFNDMSDKKLSIPSLSEDSDFSDFSRRIYIFIKLACDPNDSLHTIQSKLPRYMLNHPLYIDLLPIIYKIIRKDY
jgi:hypothetical protein